MLRLLNSLCNRKVKKGYKTGSCDTIIMQSKMFLMKNFFTQAQHIQSLCFTYNAEKELMENGNVHSHCRMLKEISMMIKISSDHLYITMVTVKGKSHREVQQLCFNNSMHVKAKCTVYLDQDYCQIDDEWNLSKLLLDRDAVQILQSLDKKKFNNLLLGTVMSTDNHGSNFAKHYTLDNNNDIELKYGIVSLVEFRVKRKHIIDVQIFCRDTFMCDEHMIDGVLEIEIPDILLRMPLNTDNNYLPDICTKTQSQLTDYRRSLRIKFPDSICSTNNNNMSSKFDSESQQHLKRVVVALGHDVAIQNNETCENRFNGTKKQLITSLMNSNHNSSILNESRIKFILENILSDFMTKVSFSADQRGINRPIQTSVSLLQSYITKSKNIRHMCLTETEMIKELRNGILFFILCASTAYSLIYMIPNDLYANTITKRFIVCILNVILVTISSNHLYIGDIKDERFIKHLTKCDLFKTRDALPFGDNNDKVKPFEKQLKYALFEARDVLKHGKVKNAKELLYDIINYDDFKCSEDIHVYPVVRGEFTNELVRVGTLSAFPDGDSPSLIRLAESGFYYDGKGRELKCFSCGLTNDVWSSTTIPLDIHRQLSPNCPYLNERFPLLAAKTTDQHIPSIAATTTEQNNIESDSSTNRGICTDSNSHVPALLTSSSSVPVTVTNGPGSVLSDSPSVGSTGYNTRRSYNTSLVTSSTGSSRSNGYSIGYGSQGSNSNSSGYGSQGSSSHSSGYGSQGSSSNSSGYGSQGSNGYSSDSVATGLTSSTNGTSGSQLHALAEADERQLPEGGSFRDSNIQPSSNRNVPKMKYPEYKTKEKRLDTYKNWPKHLTFLYPRDLTECGFFYSNFGDCVRCFHCGIGLRNWEHDDNPWVEHARWSRKCPYLLQRKGQEFVDSVLSVLGLQTDAEIAEQQSNNSSDKSAAISSGNVTGPSASNDVRDPITHPAAQYVIQEGIFGTNVERLVKKAMNQLIQAHDWENINNDMLVNAMLAYNDGTEFMETRSTIDAGTPIQPNATTNMAAQSTPMTTQANGISSSASSVETDPEKVQKENEELKDLYTCKICLDERVGITFVPCGHLVTCRNCSPKIRRCPLCRTFIRGTIKTAV